MVVEKTYLKLNTEVYGEPILNTWLDRSLSLAGRVSLKTDDPFHPETRLASIGKPILTIPNQSLHMNRKVNEGIELNKQKDMLPLLACVEEEFEKDGFLTKLIAKELDVGSDRIVDFDLFLHEHERGSIVGVNDEFISCTKLDDLAMVHAGLHALINTEAVRATNVLVCYDNEEVGNRTKQGAASPILRTLLERIVIALGKDREDFFRTIYHSFLISADMGHGIHPNAVDKHDPVNQPVINGGPMIKVSAAQNFTTDSNSAAVYEAICRQADIPVQRFVSRSDLKGGSTIGPVSSTQLDIRSIDVGNPALAMHSIRELCGVLDHYYMRKSFEGFYGI
jgi:aspartyl aminopeptidase